MFLKVLADIVETSNKFHKSRSTLGNKKIKYYIIVTIIICICLAAWQLFYKQIWSIGNMSITSINLSQLSDGSYNGNFKTPYNLYQLTVTIGNGKIINVDLEMGNNFIGYFDRDAVVVVERVVTAQMIDVDAVSGATVSSKAILKAIENALF